MIYFYIFFPRKKDGNFHTAAAACEGHCTEMKDIRMEGGGQSPLGFLSKVVAYTMLDSHSDAPSSLKGRDGE